MLETTVAWLRASERRVWLFAVVLYGVGDTATTLVGLSLGRAAEAGPVAAPLLDRYGVAALFALKAATFLGFFLVWRLLRTPGRVAVPFALAVAGAAVTAWNLFVLAGS